MPGYIFMNSEGFDKWFLSCINHSRANVSLHLEPMGGGGGGGRVCVVAYLGVHMCDTLEPGSEASRESGIFHIFRRQRQAPLCILKRAYKVSS